MRRRILEYLSKNADDPEWTLMAGYWVGSLAGLLLGAGLVLLIQWIL